MPLKDHRILITGGTGFLGQHLARTLYQDFGCRKIVAVGKTKRPFSWGYLRDGVDLRSPSSVESFFDIHGPFDLVFHLAGHNGGIGFNLEHPFDIYADNTLMAVNLLKTCVEEKVKKVVSTVASCAYPCKDILNESSFHAGPPHYTVACHGHAKKALHLASEFAYRQYGLEAVCVCPTTLFGPGDSFDPNRTKVVGAMIRRFVDAVDKGETSVTCWGSGRPMRELLYVDDAAKLIARAAEVYSDPTEILNLGSGEEYSIQSIAELVAEAAGYQGEILWDDSKPDGQFRKRLDLRKMKSLLPAIEPTPFLFALKETIQWYRKSAFSSETSR